MISSLSLCGDMRSAMETGMGARIPGYDRIPSTVGTMVSEYVPDPHIWLDTGCGTGIMVRENLERFPSTQFVLADPSSENIAEAKVLMHGEQRCLYVTKPTGSLNFGDSTVDVITAMFCHHYSDLTGRKEAAANCFRMLKKGGMYITAEHVRNPPADSDMKDKEWMSFMMANGVPEEAARHMIDRRGTEYFPLAEEEHIALLEGCGFSGIEVFMRSCSDIGLVAFR